MNQWVCRSERANVLLRLVMSGQMPQRPGAFAAQFAPETLQRFKDLCRRQDKAYSKVLERLALLYVETDGGILSTAGSAAPPSQGVQKRQVLVESLQNKLLEDLLKASLRPVTLVVHTFQLHQNQNKHTGELKRNF